MRRPAPVLIRPAAPGGGEAAALTRLARRSKAHWGYDAAFLRACRAQLTVTPEAIADHPTALAMAGDEIAGFSMLHGAPPELELEFLFIDPAFIGRGVGRGLWEHALDQAGRAGADAVALDADPHAEGFYLAMGAVRVGETPSDALPGRLLPRMRADLAHLTGR